MLAFIVEPTATELKQEAAYRAAARAGRRLPTRPKVTGDPEVLARVGTNLAKLTNAQLTSAVGSSFVVTEWENRRGEAVQIQCRVRKG